ncbi:hypothetical protein ACFPM0_24835 [Pseudonocardia sulfidoxydans]
MVIWWSSPAWSGQPPDPGNADAHPSRGGRVRRRKMTMEATRKTVFHSYE